MKKFVVVAGVVVTAEDEDEAELLVWDVMEGVMRSGLIAGIHIDYVDELQGDWK